MNTTVDRIGPDVAVIALDGELDASNFRELVDAGRQLYADGVRRLVLDMAGLTYMASSGIVAIHSLVLVFRGREAPDPEAGWDAIHAAGLSTDQAIDEVRLAAPRPNIERVLDRTGLAQMLPVHPDREAALA
jgi:stage II sporulation protein AA (anti-sigma F factor antagonist)